MKNQPVIETERLILRTPEMKDAQDIFSFMKNTKLAEYMCWKPRISIEETKRILAKQIEEINRDESWIKYIIIDKATDTTIGSLNGKLRENKVDLTYMLAEEFWQKGLMTEAILAFIEIVKKNLTQINTVMASCDTENDSSIILLENIGMKQIGTMKQAIILPNISNEKRDLFCYEMII